MPLAHQSSGRGYGKTASPLQLTLLKGLSAMKGCPTHPTPRRQLNFESQAAPPLPQPEIEAANETKAKRPSTGDPSKQEAKKTPLVKAKRANSPAHSDKDDDSVAARGPASDTLSLLQQVEALQKDLDLHMQGEARLQNINLQLRERLELFQKQNHENVERAEAELTNLHRHMDAALEVQRQLADKADQLERQKAAVAGDLQQRTMQWEHERMDWERRVKLTEEEALLRGQESVASKLAALEAENRAARAEEQRVREQVAKLEVKAEQAQKAAAEYSAELTRMVEETARQERISRSVQRIGERSVQRRNLLRWRATVLLQKRRACSKLKAHEFLRHRSKRRTLQTLSIAAARSRRLHYLHKVCSLRRSHTCWQAWKLHLMVQRRYREAVSRRRQDMLQRGQRRWRAYVVLRRLSAAKRAAAFQRSAHLQLKRCWRTWRAFTSQRRYAPSELASQLQRAYNHHERFTKKLLIHSWRWWLHNVARPRTGRHVYCERIYAHNTLRQALAHWRLYRKQHEVLQRQKRLAKCLAARIRMRHAFKSWTAVLQAKRQHRIACKDAVMWFLRRRFMCWRNEAHGMRLEKQQVARGAQCCLRLVQRRVFESWHAWAYDSRRRHDKKQLAHDHCVKMTKARYWDSWREHVQQCKAVREAIADHNVLTIKWGFQRWRAYHRRCGNVKKFMRRSVVHFQRVERQRMRDALQVWCHVTSRNKRVRLLNVMLCRRMQHLWKRRCFEMWVHVLHTRDREAFAALKTTHTELQVQNERHMERIAELDLDSVQFVDRIQEMASELAALRQEVSEHARRALQQERAAEESSLVEGSLRSELQAARIALQDRAEDIARLQAELREKQDEGTGVAVGQAMERQRNDTYIKSLTTELSSKQAMLESCEEALRDTAERLETAAGQSQEKLAGAFEIAASLRQMLEERQNALNAVAASRDAQRQATAAMEAMQAAVESRDHRITELEQATAQTQNDLQAAQAKVQEAAVALDRKNGNIRRLEYELQLVTDREQRRTDSLITSFKASEWASTDIRHAYVCVAACCSQTSIMSLYAVCEDNVFIKLVVVSRFEVIPPAVDLPTATPAAQHGGSETSTPEVTLSNHSVTVPIQSTLAQQHQQQHHQPQHTQAHTQAQAQPQHSLPQQQHRTPQPRQQQPTYKSTHALFEAATSMPSSPLRTPAAYIHTPPLRGRSSSQPQEARSHSRTESVASHASSADTHSWREVISQDTAEVADLHEEIQRLQQRIMQRLQDSPESAPQEQGLVQ
eukprot:jgi/Chlat1/6378/Chrsp44S00450